MESPSPSPRRITVLHVCEAYGGGVQNAISSWIASTPDVTHLLLVNERIHDTGEGTPSVERIMHLPQGHLRRIGFISRVFRENRPDVVHLHSSLAGLYGRLALIPTRRIAYSPHCFAFERRDVSPVVRAIFWSVEAILSFRTRMFLVVSEHESRLTKRFPLRRIAYEIPVVGISNAPQPTSAKFAPNRPVEIVAVGRLTPQKDPTFLAKVLDELKCEARFNVTWVGDGDQPYRSELEKREVRVTGWRTEAEVLDTMTRAEVIIHTAAWEGSPVVIDKAMLMGKCIVARKIQVLEDRGLSNLDSEPIALAATLANVIDNPAIRNRDGKRNRDLIESHLEERSRNLSLAYEEWRNHDA